MSTSMKPGAVISYIACALGRNNQWIRCGYRRLYSSNGVRSGRRNPFLSKESGGGVKTLPLFYDKYKKRPYMRRDHPNRHGAVDPEARNVHVSSSAFENAASFQESGTDKGASKSTGTASSDFVSGEHEPPSYQGEMEPARGGEIGKGKRSMQSHSSLSNSSRKKSMWTVADRQAQVRKRERRLLSESVLWSNQVLTSRSTSFVRHVRLLQSNEGYRTSQRKVVLTGKRVIEDLAAKMRVHPEILLLREGRKCPDSLTPRIDQISVSTATKAVLEEVDPGNDGYVAVYDLPQPSPKELLFVPPSTRATSFRHVLLLDNVQDPSCVGTLMRTAVAMCYDAVVLVNHCADLYHAATIRAARGVHFQEQTKFFVLKEEDGDDSMEIINQTIEVHGLEPLLYSPRNQIHGTRMSPKRDSPVLNAQHAVMGASFTLESTTVTRPGLHNVDPRELHDVSMTTMSFTGLERQRTDAYSGAPRSPLIIVGEDATQSLVRKYQTRLRNPTRSVIELEPNEDDAESALQVSVPLLLHALRPMAVAESGEYHPKQIASGVDAPSGPSRRDDVHQPDWDRYQSWLTRSDAGFERTAPNIVGEEAIRDHFEGFYFEKMQQRYRQYLKTDAELYEEKERIRILREARREQEEMELAHAAPPQEPASVGKERVSRYPSPMDSLQVVPTREDVRALATEQIAYRLPSRYARYTRK